MAPPATRVLLVDDSPLALTILQRLLSAAPDIEIVGAVTDGQAALSLIPRVDPHIVCTDYHMPGMDGLKLTTEIMSRFPRPILIVSSIVESDSTARAFPLLEAGAIDVFPKPAGAPGPNSEAARQFAAKIKFVAGVPVAKRAAWRPQPSSSPLPAAIIEPIPHIKPRIIGIGTSTGGPQALQVILSALPATLPVPVVCVQHISPGFLKGMLDWLSPQCRLRISVARSGERPVAGHVYFAEEQTHLTFDETGCLLVSHGEAYGGHRPSVTVTFRSLAHQYGAASIAVLLTGMGSDGAEGMEEVVKAGGLTIAQDEATSVVFGMPKQAIERTAIRYVLPLDRIAQSLINHVSPVELRPRDVPTSG